MTASTLSRSERIARPNDRARQAMGLACVAVATEGFGPCQMKISRVCASWSKPSTYSRRTMILMASAISGRSIRMAMATGRRRNRRGLP